MAAALITLREGLEAALIVAVVAMYLLKLGRGSHMKFVWAGVAAASAASVFAGALVTFGVATVPHEAQELIEAFAGLLAAAVLTWMIFWMRRQARSIRGHLEGRVDEALASANPLALSVLAFTAVGREGLETVLFLFATFRSSDDTVGSAIGAFAGLAAAAAVGVAFYQGGRRVNLALLFRLTGVLVIFVAAGLIASAIHELNEAGALRWLTATAWDTSALADRGIVAALLRGLVGYDPAPTLLQVAAYWAYVLPTLALFLRRPRVNAARGARPLIRRARLAAGPAGHPIEKNA